MAADDLQHVTKGQPLLPRLTAGWFNAVSDAALSHRNRRLNNPLPPRVSPVNPSLTTLVENLSGATRAERSVLKVIGQGLDPSGSPLEFQSRPLLTVDVPAADTDQVVIMSEPIEDDMIGEAIVAGVAVVDVLINDAAHLWAKPIAGDATKLTSATSGPARILWKAGSSGTQRCVVNLLDGQGAGVSASVSESHGYAYDNGSLDVDTDDTWTTLGEWSLPSAAGTYFITFEFSIELEVSAGEGVVWMRLYNNTQSVAAAYMAVLGGGAESDGGRFALDTEQLDTPLRQRVSTTYIVTIDEGDELLFQVKRLSGATYTTCRVAELGYDGAAFSAIKIA